MHGTGIEQRGESTGRRVSVMSMIRPTGECVRRDPWFRSEKSVSPDDGETRRGLNGRAEGENVHRARGRVWWPHEQLAILVNKNVRSGPQEAHQCQKCGAGVEN